MITIIIGTVLLLLALFGTPLFAIISLIALLAFTFVDIDTSVLMVSLYRLASTPILLPGEFFTRFYRLASRRLVCGYPGLLCGVYGFYRCFGCNHHCPGRITLPGFTQRKLSGEIFSGNAYRFGKFGVAVSTKPAYHSLRPGKRS